MEYMPDDYLKEKYTETKFQNDLLWIRAHMIESKQTPEETISDYAGIERSQSYIDIIMTMMDELWLMPPYSMDVAIDADRHRMYLEYDIMTFISPIGDFTPPEICILGDWRLK